MKNETTTPVHPGEILQKEFMQHFDLSSNALAGLLSVTPARVNEIVRGKRGISADTALRLARCLGTGPEYWLELQKRYELETARNAAGARIEHEVTVLSHQLPVAGSFVKKMDG